MSHFYVHHVSGDIRGDIRSLRCTTGVVDTGGKFSAGINDTSCIGGKFAAGVVDTGGAP
jgi:hypothetical protein